MELKEFTLGVLLGCTLFTLCEHQDHSPAKIVKKVGKNEYRT